MIEWLTVQCLGLLANFEILLANPSGCIAVRFLRTAALTLLALLAVKLAIHMLSVRLLKTRFPLYRPSEGPSRICRRLAREAGLGKAPPLHRFADRRPLAFAAGVWRPAVFLAPRLAEQLPEPELKAVLAHELTHIRRRDNLRIWLLEVFYALIPALVIQFFGLRFIFSGLHSELAVCGALFGLLFVRLVLWKPIQALREQTCDDLTVDVVGDPLLLASALIGAWRISRTVPPQAWGCRLMQSETLLQGGLQRRLKRLLNYRRPLWKFRLARCLRFAAALVLLVFVLCLAQIRLRGLDRSLMISRSGIQACEKLEQPIVPSR